MADLGKLLSEKEFAANQYLVTLHNFHLSLEQIQNHVRVDQFVSVLDILIMDIPIDIVLIAPIPQTRNNLWFVITTSNYGEGYRKMNVTRIVRTSLRTVIPIDKTPAVLLNKSFTEI